MNLFDKMRRIVAIWESRKYTWLLENENSRYITSFPPGHYYSPLPDHHDVQANRQRIFDQSISNIPGMELNSEEQRHLLQTFKNYIQEIPFPDNESPSFRYYFNNNYFVYGDAVSLFCMLRKYKPNKIIEIGSGFSSGLMLDTTDRFFELKPDYVFIEPTPARLFSILRKSDKGQVNVIEQKVQMVDESIFDSLGSGDFLFIDSSHVSKIDSDVNHLFFKVLPRLKRGVLIHFHDIVWPFEYPEEWLLKGRAWNEAYLLRAFLQHNTHYKILLFNSYLSLKEADVVRTIIPRFMDCPGGSIWLQKVC